MPHSLRVRIKNLARNNVISDKDCQRLCYALDMENVLEDIKAEIENIRYHYVGVPILKVSEVLEILDKYISGKEQE